MHYHKISAVVLGTLILPALACSSKAWADGTSSSNNTSTNSTTITQTQPDTSADDSDVVSQTEIKRVRTNDSNTQGVGQSVGNDHQQAGVGAPGVADSSANSSNDTYERTEITEKRTSPSAFRDEAVGIIPQIGVLSFTAPDGTGVSRGLAGLTVDFNFLGRVATHPGKPFFGLTIGALYSHLGQPGGDFFGNNPPAGSIFTSDTQFLLIPVDAKLGYTYSDILRFSLHAGANLLYYGSGGAPNPFTTDGSSGMNASPNIGMDLEFGVGRNVGILLRPDWTLATNTIFVFTIGLTLPMA
jgi:hypothetical protein